MRRFPAHANTQLNGCCILVDLLRAPEDVLTFVTETDCGELVCSALRFHVANAKVANACYIALAYILFFGSASSFDLDAAASLAAVALRAHQSDAAVQKKRFGAGFSATRIASNSKCWCVAGTRRPGSGGRAEGAPRLCVSRARHGRVSGVRGAAGARQYFALSKVAARRRRPLQLARLSAWFEPSISSSTPPIRIT